MTRFDIVPGASRVSVNASSSVHPIEVESSDLSGYLEVDIADGEVRPTGDPVGRIHVAVEDLKSGNRLIDRETDRRVNTKEHPDIVGELVALEPLGNGRFRASGQIRFHGVTHAVAGEMQIAADGDSVRLTGRQTFDVRNWGLEPPRMLMLKVDPDVDVEVDVLARTTGG